jgi:hypothetical protein
MISRGELAGVAILVVIGEALIALAPAKSAMLPRALAFRATGIK